MYNCFKSSKFTHNCIIVLAERLENVAEVQGTVEFCQRESSALIPSSGNNCKLSICSTNEQTKQTNEMKILDRDVSSENSKFCDNEDVSDQLFSSQSQMYSTRSSLIGNTTEDFRKHAVKRKPFRELNYDQKRRTDRQTIWRPW